MEIGHGVSDEPFQVASVYVQRTLECYFFALAERAGLLHSIIQENFRKPEEPRRPGQPAPQVIVFRSNECLIIVVNCPIQDLSTKHHG